MMIAVVPVWLIVLAAVGIVGLLAACLVVWWCESAPIIAEPLNAAERSLERSAGVYHTAGTGPPGSKFLVGYRAELRAWKGDVWVPVRLVRYERGCWVVVFIDDPDRGSFAVAERDLRPRWAANYEEQKGEPWINAYGSREAAENELNRIRAEIE